MTSRLTLLYILLSATTTIAVAAATDLSQCQNVRPEWSQMTPQQQRDFFTAVMKLQARPATGAKTTDVSRLSYADFVQIHVMMADFVHGTALFFPFHRHFINQFEAALRTTGYQGALTYWDWATTTTWLQSAPAQATTFGTTGVANKNYCLSDGAISFASGFQASDFGNLGYWSRDVLDPYSKCLQRDAGLNGPCWNDVSIKSVLDDAQLSYDAFRKGSEGYHAACHFAIGGQHRGDMADFYYSPNDVAFYLHHGMVDKQYWRWQRACPSLHQYSFDGTNTDGSLADMEELIPFFNVPVKSVLDVNANCYSTTASDLDLQTVPNCKEDVVTSKSRTSTSFHVAAATSSTSTTAAMTGVLNAGDQNVFLQTASDGHDPDWLLKLLSQLGQQPSQQNLHRRASNEFVKNISVGPKFGPQPARESFAGSRRYHFFHSQKEPHRPAFLTFPGHPEYSVRMPAGMKVIYHDATVYKLVPLNYTFNSSTGETSHPRNKMIMIHAPMHGDYKGWNLPDGWRRPEDVVPPEDRRDYPVMVTKEWAQTRGLDWEHYLTLHNKAMEAVDRYNNRDKVTAMLDSESKPAAPS